jgi:hypothetical protein
MSQIRLGRDPLLAGSPPSVRLEMTSIDHQLIGFVILGRQLGKESVEHAQGAPADEPVIDRLMRAVISRCVTPTEAVPNRKDDATHDTAIINPRNAMRQWEIRLDPAHLHLALQPQGEHQQQPLGVAIESSYLRLHKRSNRS